MVEAPKKSIQGFLIDLDGVLYIEEQVIPGATETVNWLRQRGSRFRFLTNTTMQSQSSLAKKLTRMGIRADPGEVFNTCVVATRWLANQGISRVHLLLTEDARQDFSDFEITTERPEAVIVGDLGKDYNFAVLNEAFLSLKSGARLIALQKNRFWRTEKGLAMDAGAFVAALEYAADTQAALIGKPNRAYFETALEDMQLLPSQAAMIGDDIETDIQGARALGAKTILVRTGKYPFDREKPAEIQPDWTIESIQELPRLLESAGE